MAFFYGSIGTFALGPSKSYRAIERKKFLKSYIKKKAGNTLYRAFYLSILGVKINYFISVYLAV